MPIKIACEQQEAIERARNALQSGFVDMNVFKVGAIYIEYNGCFFAWMKMANNLAQVIQALDFHFSAVELLILTYKYAFWT